MYFLSLDFFAYGGPAAVRRSAQSICAYALKKRIAADGFLFNCKSVIYRPYRLKKLFPWAPGEFAYMRCPRNNGARSEMAYTICSVGPLRRRNPLTRHPARNRIPHLPAQPRRICGTWSR